MKYNLLGAAKHQFIFFIYVQLVEANSFNARCTIPARARAQFIHVWLECHYRVSSHLQSISHNLTTPIENTLLARVTCSIHRFRDLDWLRAMMLDRVDSGMGIEHIMFYVYGSASPALGSLILNVVSSYWVSTEHCSQPKQEHQQWNKLSIMRAVRDGVFVAAHPWILVEVSKMSIVAEREWARERHYSSS